MVAPPTEHEILDVNRRYHDVAAGTYDSKWGISFGEIGHLQVLGKITKLLGSSPGPFAHALEIGSGTGYFSLNLLQPVASLPVQIYNYARSPYLDWQAKAWGAALILIGLIGVLSLLSRWAVSRRFNLDRS